jgi:hypothetical protein
MKRVFASVLLAAGLAPVLVQAQTVERQVNALEDQVEALNTHLRHMSNDANAPARTWAIVRLLSRFNSVKPVTLNNPRRARVR